MQGRSWIIGLLLAASWAQAAPSSLGYRLPAEQQLFSYYVDDRAASVAGISFAQANATTSAAYSEWDRHACSALNFANLGGTSGAVGLVDPRDPYDAFNVSTIWVTDPSDVYYDFALGRGAARAAAVPLSYAGIVYQCDIYINGVDGRVSAEDVTPTDRVDLQTLVLHEIGHCLGMGHSPTSDSVMYPFVGLGEQGRLLQPSDVAALCSSYPAPGAFGGPCLVDGGCDSAGTGPLTCLAPPVSDGGVGPSLCTAGCEPSGTAICPAPLVCEPSSLLPTAGAVCLMPSLAQTLVGRPCSSSLECGAAGAECLVEQPAPSGGRLWEGGLCTQPCSSQLACPLPSTCVSTAAGERCLPSCQPGASACRPGYVCALTGESYVCQPGCTNDLDCGSTMGGGCRSCEGACYPPAAETVGNGAPCERSLQCPVGHLCLKQAPSHAFGVCALPCGDRCGGCAAGFACQVADDHGTAYCLSSCVGTQCGAGLQCKAFASGMGCVAGCQSEVDCPLGLICAAGRCEVPSSDAGVEPEAPALEPIRSGCGCSSPGEALIPGGLILLWLNRLRTRGRGNMNSQRASNTVLG